MSLVLRLGFTLSEKKKKDLAKIQSSRKDVSWFSISLLSPKFSHLLNYAFDVYSYYKSYCFYWTEKKKNFCSEMQPLFLLLKCIEFWKFLL